MFVYPSDTFAKRYTVFSNGRSDYSIVVHSGAPKGEKDVAAELQQCLQEIASIQLPVLNEKGGRVGRRIIIGDSDLVKRLSPGSETFDENDESFTYFNVGGDIIIYGGSKRGTAYGVYSFLEHELSCRWYTKDINILPKKRKWGFCSLSHSESPEFSIRNVYFRSILDKKWVMHSRNSGEELYWGCHTMNLLVPPSKYYKRHPEYYSLHNGKRDSTAQLCLTNPALVSICADALREVIKSNPNYLIYDLSQNDNQFPCQCAKCSAVVKEEGSESGPIIRFVNQVADRLKDEFPDKYIGTFAYTYSRKAPLKVRPRENVIVRLCDGECCFAHSLEACEKSKQFCRDLAEWSKISSNLFVWDYVTPVSEYLLPYPNLHVLQENIQFFKKNNVKGVIEEGSYRSYISDMSDLKYYLLTKLLWDSNSDVDELTKNYLNDVYGRSARYIKEYIDYMRHNISEDIHINKNYYREDAFYSEETIANIIEIFNNAENAAENEVILDRVRMARIPIDYLYVRRFPKRAKLDGSLERFKNYTEKKKIHWVNRKTRISDVLESFE